MPSFDPRSLDLSRLTTRRDLLRAAAIAGAWVAGKPLLGQSLLLRDGPEIRALLPAPTTLTRSVSRSYTLGGTIPPTFTMTLTSTATKPAGTHTFTKVPDTGRNGSLTDTFPAPGGGVQTITVAYTDAYSYSPPATLTHTESWNGSSYTLTSSRTPSWASMSISESYSCSYTSTISDEKPKEPLAAIEARDACVPLVETVDYDGIEALNPADRHPGAKWVRFGHAAGNR